MKRELKIIGLSYAQSQSNGYVCVLSEVNGLRKIPIIVKPQDAQTIAIKLENLKLPRPITHDIVKNLTTGYGINFQEVCIYSILEGVFYCKALTNNGIDDLEIEMSVGDAIVFSLLYECPLYAKEEVLATVGIQTDDSGKVVPSEHDKPKKTKKKEQVVSIEDLNRMMDEAIINEEYELAAELRDKITKLEDKNK
jgi:bifunctional DNase/RNase